MTNRTQMHFSPLEKALLMQLEFKNCVLFSIGTMGRWARNGRNKDLRRVNAWEVHLLLRWRAIFRAWGRLAHLRPRTWSLELSTHPHEKQATYSPMRRSPSRTKMTIWQAKCLTCHTMPVSSNLRKLSLSPSDPYWVKTSSTEQRNRRSQSLAF